MRRRTCSCMLRSTDPCIPWSPVPCAPPPVALRQNQISQRLKYSGARLPAMRGDACRACRTPLAGSASAAVPALKQDSQAIGTPGWPATPSPRARSRRMLQEAHCNALSRVKRHPHDISLPGPAPRARSLAAASSQRSKPPCRASSPPWPRQPLVCLRSSLLPLSV